MGTSLQVFDRLQVGIEVVSTKGTLVAATRQIIGNHGWSEEQDFYRSPYPEGYRATPGGAGVIMRKGVSLDIETELSAEDVLWPLMTGVLGSVTPTVSDVSAQTWVFTPQLTTSVATIQSLTAEFLRGDGVTNHYYGESGYMMTESFGFEWAYNQVAKMKAKLFGRARQTDTPTAALVPYPTREALVSNTLIVSLDTTWAGLGGSALSGIVRSASFDCITGYAANYTLAGRADVDHTGHKVGIIGGTLNLVMEFDAAGAAAALTNWRANNIVFIRLKNTGSLAGAATVSRGVQVDGAYRFVSTPTFSVDGEQVLVTASLEAVRDTTANKILEFTAINKLAAIA